MSAAAMMMSPAPSAAARSAAARGRAAAAAPPIRIFSCSCPLRTISSMSGTGGWPPGPPAAAARDRRRPRVPGRRPSCRRRLAASPGTAVVAVGHPPLRSFRSRLGLRGHVTPRPAISRRHRPPATRIVTSSSAAVGCTAIVRSKSSLVAPMRSATAASWMISAAPWPTTWTPSTRPPSAATTSFISIRSSRPVSVLSSGRKQRAVDLDRAPRARASASVAPIAAASGRVKIAVGISRWSDGRGRPPNTVSAKAWPSWIATGVSASRSVTSPTA